MKILTWNIQATKGCDGFFDTSRIIAEILKFGPVDVICLQEVARHIPSLGSEDQVAHFSKQFSDFDTQWAPGFSVPDESGARSEFGNLTLVRKPLLKNARVHNLPSPLIADLQIPRTMAEVVVGGKDTSSNETIVKKHLEKNDLYFHTELRGAPSTVLKNPDNVEIPELTIKETATFAASYSNAWREGWGSTKIYYVNPDQVTKSPKAGEYLSKGSFFIKGEKNFLPAPYLELTIGLVLEVVGQLDEDIDGDKNIYFPKIIAGPQSAIKSQTEKSVRIKPQRNGLSSGKLAQKIKAHFITKAAEEVKKWVKLMDVNHIIHFLPPGKSTIAKK